MKHPLIAASVLSTAVGLALAAQAPSVRAQGAAMLLVLLCRGAGKWSLDYLAWQRIGRVRREDALAA
jgi:putative oxidoreductase